MAPRVSGGQKVSVNQSASWNDVTVAFLGSDEKAIEHQG
jgi:hypothetical protein